MTCFTCKKPYGAYMLHYNVSGTHAGPFVRGFCGSQIRCKTVNNHRGPVVPIKTGTISIHFPCLFILTSLFDYSLDCYTTQEPGHQRSFHFDFDFDFDFNFKAGKAKELQLLDSAVRS